MKFVDCPSANGENILHVNLDNIKLVRETTIGNETFYYVDDIKIDKCQYERLTTAIVRAELGCNDRIFN